MNQDVFKVRRFQIFAGHLIVVDDGMELPLASLLIEWEVETETDFFTVLGRVAPAGDNLVVTQSQKISGH